MEDSTVVCMVVLALPLNYAFMSMVGMHIDSLIH